MAAEVEAEPELVPAIVPEVKPEPEVKRVTMKLCTRVAGVIKCEPEGFRATYAPGTIGPIEVSLRYPD